MDQNILWVALLAVMLGSCKKEEPSSQTDMAAKNGVRDVDLVVSSRSDASPSKNGQYRLDVHQKGLYLNGRKIPSGAVLEFREGPKPAVLRVHAALPWQAVWSVLNDLRAKNIGNIFFETRDARNPQTLTWTHVSSLKTEVTKKPQDAGHDDSGQLWDDFLRVWPALATQCQVYSQACESPDEEVSKGGKLGLRLEATSDVVRFVFSQIDAPPKKHVQRMQVMDFSNEGESPKARMRNVMVSDSHEEQPSGKLAKVVTLALRHEPRALDSGVFKNLLIPFCEAHACRLQVKGVGSATFADVFRALSAAFPTDTSLPPLTFVSER